ncbi:putative Sodium-coupled neutral amino acid transporter 3-like protein, partial [Naja naja]
MQQFLNKGEAEKERVEKNFTTNSDEMLLDVILGHIEWYMDGQILIVVVSVSVILPLALMKHLGYLGYTSGLSLTCMCFFLSSIPCPFNDTVVVNSTMESSHDTCSAEAFPLNSQTAYAIPILAFAFVCHPEVLPIYTELRRPSKRRMQSVANVSILAMFSMYLLTAIFGYLTFYGNVEAEMLHTYIRVDPLDKLILCVRLAVLLAVTLTVPVVLFPIRRAIQQLLFPKKDFSWIRHVIIAFCLLFIVNLLVIFVPNIKDIFGVIGATSAPSLIFILPSIFYIRIIPNEKEPLRSRPKIQAACFAALGFIFMVMSLTFIIVDWVTTGKSSGASKSEPLNKRPSFAGSYGSSIIFLAFFFFVLPGNIVPSPTIACLGKTTWGLFWVFFAQDYRVASQQGLLWLPSPPFSSSSFTSTVMEGISGWCNFVMCNEPIKEFNKIFKKFSLPLLPTTIALTCKDSLTKQNTAIPEEYAALFLYFETLIYLVTFCVLFPFYLAFPYTEISEIILYFRCTFHQLLFAAACLFISRELLGIQYFLSIEK